METIAIRNFNKYYEDLTAEELLVKYYQTYGGRPVPKKHRVRSRPIQQLGGLHQLN
jgi:ribosomal protein L20A (L18A)